MPAGFLWPMLVTGAILVLTGCAAPRTGVELARRGDEIVICGRYFHTGAPVVLWTDPGGYDAYRVERRFVPADQAAWGWTDADGKRPGPVSPNRYDVRNPRGSVTGPEVLTPEELERVRGGGWDLPTLRRVVDQFVIHYDVAGTSRQCFKVLHDLRGLSVHFMLDLDGTIYQTLDVKERAWHATTSNHRSIGIEIANIGAYPAKDAAVLDRWYARDDAGRVRVTLPDWMDDGGVRTPGFVARPIRDEPIRGVINGSDLRQYDLTPEQYDSLIRLTAALCTALPGIRCDYPRDAAGSVIPSKLSDDELASYSGLLGHWHVQENKTDPGPAFQWDRVIAGARRRMGIAPTPRRAGLLLGPDDGHAGRRPDRP
ncbi:MAG: N-acetylmuramoyl-L-alanine amidase [Phycisphaerales bacterium]